MTDTILDCQPLRTLDGATRDRIARCVDNTSFAPFENAITPEWLATLQHEAADAFDTAKLAEGLEGLSYRANITSLTPAARQFLSAPTVVSLLTDYFGGRYVLTDEISCLTFYDPSGHLGPHLDEPAEKCDVTIIIYLYAVSPEPTAEDTGLVLKVYGQDESSIGTPRLCIPTRAGTIVLGRGSKVWHERPRLKPGEAVTAITGCFRRAS